ncbi:MAG: photosystem I reaction center subunit PsaK [Cyanobacteria bacterium P01_G01_bin.54]
MIDLTLIAAASTLPLSTGWTPTTGIVMVVCNIIAIAIGKTTMAEPGAGEALPMPTMFGGMGWPALLATMSFGHILGFLTLVLLNAHGVV